MKITVYQRSRWVTILLSTAEIRINIPIVRGEVKSIVCSTMHVVVGIEVEQAFRFPSFDKLHAE